MELTETSPERPTFIVSESTSDKKSKDQHDDLIRALHQAGAYVQQIPLVPNLPDSVFVKDNAVLLQSQNKILAFLGWPKYEDRQIEQAHREASFRKLGFEIADKAQFHFEGGDLQFLADGQTALLGYGFRTDRQVVKQLSRFLHRKVIPLELTDPTFFHLDLALGTLSDGTVFACPEVLSVSAWKTLENLESIRELVPVSREDAYEFCLNWVQVEQTVILAARAEKVISKLRSLGFQVIITDLDEFHQFDGSIACLTAKINTLPN